VRVRDAVRPLGDRLHQPHLIDPAVQRQHFRIHQRCRAADDENGNAIEVRVGDAGDDVGHSRARRDDRHAGAAGGAGPAVRRMSRRLFVTRVDQPDSAIQGGLEDRVEMAAVQGEDLFDPLLLQNPDQHLAAVNTRHNNSSRSISVGSITDTFGDQPLDFACL
jgi:hypothetical protein